MYRYDTLDQNLVDERARQFRGQVARRLSGELSEAEFRPLRLMNGLYLQLHAYMVRVAIPYGTLSADQMRALAYIARTWDRGYGHFTTRQNIQFNWPNLADVPDILDALAAVEMHAIQTSGNCIRNVTADAYAGVADDEVADPRVYAEIIRQWSSLHPEFSFLPRKFKVAVTGAPQDRAALRVHDIGLRLCRDSDGALGFEVMVGGGQGRTPMIGTTIRSFLPEADLLTYLEAILRVYNMLGRRDNLYKARIKILVHSLGAETFAAMVEDEWHQLEDTGPALPAHEIKRIRAFFLPPTYEDLEATVPEFEARRRQDTAFARWCQTNLARHRRSGYAIVDVSLKPEGGSPGDIMAEQMEAVADLAKRYSFGEIRVTHAQNLVLPHVKLAELSAVWEGLAAAGLETPNVGLVTDIIACPGLDFCNLANARSIPVAQRIIERFRNLDRQHDIGELRINISGCINACGHHHVGHIGILGVDRKGEEYYQITLGGSSDETASLGKVVGPSFSYDAITDAVEVIVTTYLAQRCQGERFLDTYRRVGAQPFKEDLYGIAQG
ncbi:MAG: nitrite/sulfite reductase [Rhodospirillales bacterium]|jgi:sulfite reductase (NADPH) hemoprotein beta-component|nr:nitrite/sulfite reductase [Rhodospirillales bacterium]HJO98000.1 nitrite/sulfite reductase [Rhodospirillales bacterium]